MNKLKHLVLVIAATVTGATTAVAGDSISTVMSLDRCIEIALSENPTIRVADMEITRLDLSRKATIGQLLPTISFEANYSRMLAKQVAYMNMDGFGDLMGGGGGAVNPDDPAVEAADESAPSRDNGIKMGLDNSYQMGFNASMPLIAPQLWKTLKLSDTQIIESIEKARTSRLQLVKQVKDAYYSLLLARESRNVIEQNIDMARFTATMYQNMFNLGTASQFDVLRTQVAVKNLEPQLTQTEIAIKQARLQLLLLMGIGEYIEVEPDVNLGEYEKTMYDRTMAFDRDISRNSDLRQLDLQARMLDESLEVQKMAWYPTLSLMANYNWTSSSDGSPLKNFRWNPYSVIGLSLSFPIFQGGRRLNSIRQAQVQVNQMKWQRDNLVNSIKMQVDLAFENIQLNVKQISSCAESVKQATTAHDIARRSFEIGAGSYLDLRDAELALTQSRMAYNQAIYNYLVASADLELLLGRYDIEPFMPAFKSSNSPF